MGGGEATSSTTIGSSLTLWTETSEPAGTSTLPHCRTDLLRRPTMNRPSPARTVKMASAARSSIGPMNCLESKHRTSLHSFPVSYSVSRRTDPSSKCTRSFRFRDRTP